MAKPMHVYETFIRATPERIWEALTSPDQTARYYYECRLQGHLASGNPYAYVGEHGPAIEGEIREFEPPFRLAMTFRVLFDEEAAAEEPSLVTWEITQATESVCRVRVTHSDFGGLSKTYSVTVGGWELICSALKSFIETGEGLGSVPDMREGDVVAVDMTAEEHRTRGIEIYNSIWPLVEKPDRSPRDDAEMIRAAYASTYHWGHAARATIVNEARGEWMISRVFSLTGNGQMALLHADRCAEAVRQGGLQDFDLAYACEARARALACLGRLDEARVELEAARSVPIADDDDRVILEGDLSAEPWFGLGVSA
jgi:uncharacterized protein YndB with AHSA1/START domain